VIHNLLARIRLQIPAFPLFVAFGIGMLAWLLTLHVQLDPDYWWHVLIGEWIVANRAVPSTDLLSWMADAPSWLAHEWLGEVMLYISHQIAGTTGSVVIFGAVTGAALLLTASLIRLVAPSLRAPAVWSLVLIGVLVALPIWSPRSQMWDVLFALLTLRMALGYLLAGQRRLLWLMPLAMVVWVNVHAGGVLLYGLLLLAVMVGEVLNRRYGWRAQPQPWRPLLWSLLATVAAMALNPYGLAVYVWPFQTVFSPVVQGLIVEWLSPDFQSPWLRPAQLFIAAGLVGLVGLARPRDFIPLCVAAGMTLMALQSVRYIGLFGPITVAVLSLQLSDGASRLMRGLTGKRLQWAPWLKRQQLLLSTIIVVAVMTVAVAKIFTLSPTVATDVLAQHQPVAAATFLRENPQSGRMFNAYGWGGFLAYELRTPVGLYGASEAFSSETLADFKALIESRQDPRSYLDQLEIDYVIYDAERNLDYWLREAPEWQQIYRDQIAVIYRRVAP